MRHLVLVAALAISTMTAIGSASAQEVCRSDQGGQCGPDLHQGIFAGIGRGLSGLFNGGGRRPNGYAMPIMPRPIGRPAVIGVPYNIGRPVGIGGGYQNGGRQAMGGMMPHLVAHNWTGKRLPDGTFVCVSGPCPRNGALGD